MERSRNPVWTQCLTAVEPALEELGFRLAAESHLYAHFATRDRNERHLWSERQPMTVDPPPTNVRAHVLRPGPVADEYIANLVVALRRLAAGPKGTP